MAAAEALTDRITGEWRVQREGTPFATVTTQRDGAGVLVSTELLGVAGSADRIRPYRFPDLNAADSFVRDLVASFSYLGCQVAHA
jgi:hypothetical protein